MTAYNSKVEDRYDDIDDNMMMLLREGLDTETFERFCKIFGGQKIVIPGISHLSEGKRLAQALGLKAAKKILDCVGVEAPQEFYVPLLENSVQKKAIQRVEELLAENGLSVQDVATLSGSTVRTVYRRKARMRQRGLKLGDPKQPGRQHAPPSHKGADIIRQLLIEGHSPSFLRDIMNIPATVILTIRAELLKQGKLN